MALKSRSKLREVESKVAAIRSYVDISNLGHTDVQAILKRELAILTDLVEAEISNRDIISDKIQDAIARL